MKTSIIALTVIAGSLSFTATAKQTGVSEYCTKVESLAKWIMRNRQNEVSMSDIIKVAGDNKIAILITQAAYKERAQRYPPNQERKIKEFGNKYYMACYNASKGK